jgi:intraflagellar transport protein 172
MDLVRMACFAGEWDEAYKLASQYLGSSEVSSMYISHAKSLEEQGKLREAEKLYLFVSEPDMAISMYKKQRQYDQVRRVKITILPPLGSGKLYFLNARCNGFTTIIRSTFSVLCMRK